jgi:hypothetical protein
MPDLDRACIIASSATALPPEQRGSLVEAECGHDAELKQCVLTLLTNHERARPSIRPRTPTEIWRTCRGDWKCGNKPDSKALAEKLATQIDNWGERGGPFPDESLLIQTLRSGGSNIPIWACHAMSVICEYPPAPVEFALRVFKACTAAPRGWMMRYFIGTPAALAAIVEAGLGDTSGRVREWA